MQARTGIEPMFIDFDSLHTPKIVLFTYKNKSVL